MSAPVFSSSTIEDGVRQLAPERLRAALANSLPKGATAGEQTLLKLGCEARPGKLCGMQWRDGLLTRSFRWRG
jgi:hypothetical protein